MSNHRWKIAIAAGLASVVCYLLVPSTTGKAVIYECVGIGVVSCLSWAVWRGRPADRSGWICVLLTMCCFVLGDTIYNIYVFRGIEEPYPSISDVFYLAGYPLMFTGVMRISRTAVTEGARERRADAAIVCVGATALCWQFLIHPDAGTGASTLGHVVAVAYPIMDLGICFILLFAALSGPRRPVDTLLMSSVCVMVTSDFVYDVLIINNLYSFSGAINCAFLFQYSLLAAAALHPSISLREEEPRVHAASARLRLPLVTIAGLVAPILIVVDRSTSISVDVTVLAILSVVLFLLVLLRMEWLLTRIASQASSLQAALSTQQSLQGDLARQAFHDTLTGLANRTLLDCTLAAALTEAVDGDESVAICFCDLDGFKSVNDSMGHHAGDQLLTVIAGRLSSIVRGSDTVARLGGDEFAVLLTGITDRADAVHVTERIVAALARPVEIEGRQVTLSVSVGIAFSRAGVTASELLADADAAMYEAKAAGKDQYHIFEPALRARIVEQMALRSSFEGALERGEFHLEYQPQTLIADGSLIGFEALVRWRHPERGLISPYQFIPLAEESGFIVPLGRWVLEAACATAVQWDADGGAALDVSVNLSTRQLQSPRLVSEVADALAHSGLPASRLVLEITESLLMADADRSAEILGELKAMGIRIAIDDFGTGYSSLSYLRQFPIDILKIDKSFIDPLTDPRSDGTAFVRTILRLARDLKLSTTAEGIETAGQLATLAQLGCASGQGYLMSRPLPPEAASAFIRSSRPAVAAHR